jgi:carbon monoxide dehydrogenase subunit G
MRLRAGALSACERASGDVSGFVWMSTLFTSRSIIVIIVNRLVNKNISKNPRIKGMELTGDILIGARREKVWAGLNDPEILMRCIPGCESMESTSPTERTARVAVKVGPVRARFVGNVRMEDIRPNEGCVLRFQGSGGAAGMAKGHSNVELTDEDGGTRLRYTAQAAIGGKLGQVGGRMIDAASKQMADQFFTAFNEQMVAEPEPMQPAEISAAAAPGIAAAAPSTFVPRSIQAPQPASSGEGVRVLWFALGALSTGFGVWIASLFTS